MNRALAHRGPDGEGVHCDRSLGLGHRRLAILDLGPTGHQPMSYAAERYWITYNGEVYNFLELQSELEGKGYAFRSTSDTEVILAAYDAWGPECLLKFNGMWSFAIWDSREQTLFLARDRFGIKPLFFIQTANYLAFASEMKAFLELPDFVPQVNLPVFKAELLDQHSQEGGENCLLEGVSRLPPGHFALCTVDGVRVTRWWSTRDHLVSVPHKLDDQAGRFRELFEDSCRLRMRSDVPIGTSLSGGLDSSAVACTVAHVAGEGGSRLAHNWQRAFVATFPGTPVDERPYAEAVVARTGVQPYYLEITPDSARAAIEKSVFHLEQLVAGPLSVLWLIYEHQRRNGVTVTLDGHGGDELLAGYPMYTLSALYDAGSWPGSPRRYRELLDIYSGLQASPADAGPHRERDWVQWETDSWRRNLRRIGARAGLKLGPAGPSLPPQSWLSPAFSIVREARHQDLPRPKDASQFQSTLYDAFHETVFPLILRNYDRMSMAHGVEVRMPFVDWRLVTFAFSLPPSSLLGQGYTKLILRKGLSDLLPEAVRTRRDKIGFASPLSQWLQGSWREWLLDELSAREFLSSPLWDGAAIRAYAEGCMKKGVWTWDSWSHVWSYLHASLWLRRFASSSVRAAPL